MPPGASYYLLTSLPMLAEPGTLPPLSPAELHDRAVGSAAAALVDVILLSDDLRQRQALLTGEVAEAEPAVLTRDQMTGDAPLPEALVVAELTKPSRLLDDVVQEAYWHHAAHVARRFHSAFLRGWIGMEVALRNALASARAHARGPSNDVLGPSNDVLEVASDLAGAGGTTDVVEAAIAAWAAAPDPLAGLRSLLAARWDWATGAGPSFTFGRDEVAAYAVKLLLLRDWRRTMGVAA